MSFLGSIIGGIGSLFGADMGADAAIKGSKIQAKAQKAANKANLKYQNLYANNAVSWKVRDALRAGIHPIAALGANTVSFSPSFVGGNAGAGVAEAGAQMGAGISRAASAFSDIGEKDSEFMVSLQKLQLENMALQNAKLASDVAQNTQAGTPPAAPSPSNRYLVDGQGSSIPAASTLVSDQPLKRVASDPKRLSQEAGAVTDTGFLKTRDGWAPVRSADAAERLEDDTLGSLQHFLRNRIKPVMDLDAGAPFAAPQGKKWAFNHITGEYFLRDVGPRGGYKPQSLYYKQ